MRRHKPLAACAAIHKWIGALNNGPAAAVCI
jgi:hypothetical protein